MMARRLYVFWHCVKRPVRVVAICVYGALCVGLTVHYLASARAPDAWFRQMGATLAALWSPTNDPVLNVLIDLGLVALVVALVLGMVLVMFYGLLAAVFLLLAYGVVSGLFTVAAASPTGAVMVAAAVSTAAWWLLFRRWRKQTLRTLDAIGYALWRAGHPAAWLVWRRAAREERTMANSAKEKAPGDKEEAVAEAALRGAATAAARAAPPELPLEPLPRELTEYGSWLEQARKRFEYRSLQHTNAEWLTILDQVAQYYEKYLKIRRLRGERERVEQEERVKGLELDARGEAVNIKLEDLKAQRERGKAANDRRSKPANTPGEALANVLDAAAEGLGDGDPEKARLRREASRLRTGAAVVQNLKTLLTPEQLADPFIAREVKRLGIRLD